MRAVVERLRGDPGGALLVLALAAAVLLYGATLDRGLVNYDDPWLVADNWILHDASWSSLHKVFFDTSAQTRFVLGAEYLPVRDVSIMLDCAVWGTWYGGFHLTNVVLYLLAITLWFKVLYGFGIDRKIAGLAMLVWALHPAHAESVAWIAERKGLLGCVFAGLAGLGYVRFRAGRPMGWLVLAMLAGVAAVWSKAPAAFGVAALAGLEVVLPEHRRSWRRSLAGLAAIAVVAGAAFIPVLMVAKEAVVVGGGDQAPASAAEMALGVHGFYLQLAAMLVKNSSSYPIATEGPPLWLVIAGGLGLALAIAAALPLPARWRASPPVRAAALLWLFCWFPVSRLVLPLRTVLVNDRYLLLPTLGFALVVAVALWKIANPKLRALAIAALCVLATLRAFEAQRGWRDDRAFWQRAAESNPKDGEAWSMYAEVLARDGEAELAEDAVGRGLAYVRAPRLLMRGALLLLARGERAEGLAYMREAAEHGEPRAKSNLALLLLEDGKANEALTFAKAGAADMPMHEPAQRTYGKVALAAKHYDEAVTAFTRAYELQPANLANRYNLGISLLAVHRGAEARPHLEACLRSSELAPLARAALASMSRP